MKKALVYSLILAMLTSTVASPAIKAQPKVRVTKIGLKKKVDD